METNKNKTNLENQILNLIQNLENCGADFSDCDFCYDLIFEFVKKISKK